MEIYNKPDFSYREESFSILMVNAWELLLKAKWVLDHQDDEQSLYEQHDDGSGTLIPEMNRSGNPVTHGASYLVERLFQNEGSGLERGCRDNVFALMEIRNNAVHFLHKDVYLSRRILEVGTASLRNYLQLASEWFHIDLSRYNFFLMPISFFHGFEAMEPVTTDHYTEQTRKLLVYLDSLEAKHPDDRGQQHVSLAIETRLVKGGSQKAVEFRITNDPSAPEVILLEEDVRKKYPMTYRELTSALRERYVGFLANQSYHKLRKELVREGKHSTVRLLDPANPGSSKQRFYSSSIFQAFDRHYIRKRLDAGS